MEGRISLSTPHMSDEGFELHYVHDAFNKNWIAPLGENVNEFERVMAGYVGRGCPVALSAGTAALHLAMILAGVKPGDRVFCQSLTFAASCNPVAYLGAEPVFIDSDRQTWNMDPAALERAFAIYGKPAAVVIDPLFAKTVLDGKPGQLETLLAEANAAAGVRQILARLEPPALLQRVAKPPAARQVLLQFGDRGAFRHALRPAVA